MTETAGFSVPSWLPERIQRALVQESMNEAKTAAVAEKERQAKERDAHDKAVLAYKEQAELRGEHISAMEVACGEVQGRSLQDIFASALAASEEADARAAVRERKAAQGEVPVLVGEGSIGRSWSDGWPSSSYERDRLIRQHEDNHRWMVMFEAHRNYPSALEATRAKSTYGQREAMRGGSRGGGEITRGLDDAEMTVW